MCETAPAILFLGQHSQLLLTNQYSKRILHVLRPEGFTEIQSRT